MKEEQSKILKWIQTILLNNNIPELNSVSQLQDGYVLCLLAENLTGKKIEKKIQSPSHPAHKVLNANYALESFKSIIQVVGCTANDIYEGNEKLLLGILSQLFKYYQLKQKLPQKEEIQEISPKFQEVFLQNTENEEVVKLKTELQEALNQLKEYKDKYNQFDEERNIFLHEIQSYQKKEEELQVENTKLKENSKMLVQELENLSNENEQIKKENTEMKEKLLNIENENQNLKETVQENEKEMNSMKNSIQVTSQRIKGYENGILTIQEKYFLEMDKKEKEKETELTELKLKHEKELMEKIKELEIQYNDEKEKIFTEYEKKIEEITKDFKRTELELRLENDILQNDKIGQLAKSFPIISPRMTLSDKASALLVGTPIDKKKNRMSKSFGERKSWEKK